MRPGAYRLTQDIKNPDADKRMKIWTAWPVLKAGTIFVCNVYGRLTMKGERSGSVQPDEKLGKLIVEFVERAEDDVGTIMRKYDAQHWHAYAVAEILIDQGIITLKQLDAALSVNLDRE